MSEFHVFGIGNPLIDYLVETDDEHVRQINLQKGRMHLIDGEVSQRLRDSLRGRSVKKSCGDSSANTLAAMAALGSRGVFLGKAGNDEDGFFYESSLAAEQVHPLIQKADVPTGSCMSFITPDGERTLATHLGACLHLRPEDLDLEKLKESRCLHLTAYSLEEEGLRQTALLALKTAKSSGLLVSLDLADSALIGRIKPALGEIIESFVSTVFSNEKEAEAFTGAADPKDAARLLGAMVKTAVVKIGEKGSWVCHNGEVTHIPAFRVLALDTTGAGDCYNAGFLHGVLNGFPVKESAMLGSYVAAKVVAQVGARLSDEAKDDIRKKAREILQGAVQGEKAMEEKNSVDAKNRGVVKMESGSTFEVRDLSLAEQGLRNIEWAEKEMGALMKIKGRFAKDRPLQGIRVGLALHVTKETAVLVKTLMAGGAQVSITGCNPLSTQDDISAALVKLGVQVYAYKGESKEDYYRYLNKVIEFKPHVTIDDGCDLVSEIHLKHPALIAEIHGGCEETTTGIHRLHAMHKDRALKYPMIAVNDNKTKHLLDNYYGTGQSTFDGILRASNILIAGKTVVVAGYGSCGKGVSLRAKGLGAEVIVTEVHPFRALQARLDGVRVMPMMEAAGVGDIFVTVTGNAEVITKDHMALMKDNAILANSGHFDNEIDMKYLNASALKRNIRPWFDEYTLKTGKRLYVAGEGRLVNLACAEGHPSAVMSTSFCGQALAVEYCVKNKGKLPIGVHPLPEEIDDEIAMLQLQAMGISIDSLTERQKQYMSSWQEGT